MSTYATPLSEGKTSPQGFLRFLGKIFTDSGVVESTALTVSAQDTPDMSVKVSGSTLDDNLVLVHTDGHFIHAWNDADANVTITSNSSGVEKTDAIVAYVALDEGQSAELDPPNNPDSLHFVAVRRSGSDTGNPTSGEVETAVSSNPYLLLAYVTVANGASSINSGNITDERGDGAQIAKELLEPLGTDQYGDETVTEAKQAVKSSYSTSEVNTGAKWVDGKDIYKKTVSLGTLPNAAGKNVAHGITGISFVVAVSGVASSGTTYLPLPYTQTTASESISVFVNSTNIGIGAGTDRSAYTTSYITILYTKS